MADKDATQTPDLYNITLSISFNGPMFFDFKTSIGNGQVDIYVPYCPYHQAGFFFQTGSYSEVDLFRDATQKRKSTRADGASERCYTISSNGFPLRTSLPRQINPCSPGSSARKLKTYTPTPGQQNQTQSKADADPIFVLSIPSGTKRGSRQADMLCKRLFKITVPMPVYLTSLYTDKLAVSTKAAYESLTGIEHATALRFFYDWTVGNDVNLSLPSLKPKPITPPIYRELPSIADIEVRYDGINLLDENDDHSDARSCFANLAALAGVGSWWLNYDDSKTTPSSPIAPPFPPKTPSDARHTENARNKPSLFIKTGSDCHAPLITTGITL